MSAEPAPAARPEAGEVAPAATDWLRNTLTVHGPSAAMAAFREASAGSGVIPWRLDLDRLEEDWFLPMAGPADGVRSISLAGARILARRLREATAARHDRSLERLARGDRSCPLDLHRLCPVPSAVLQLGPDDPASRAWLWTHWGTTRGLRHVRALPAKLDRRRKHTDALAVEFWSADWSPWHAVVWLRRDWPRLTLELVPDYADG